SASPAATPKASTRPLPTCTAPWSTRSAAAAEKPAPPRTRSRASRTASPAWRSSKPPSAAPRNAAPGPTCPHRRSERGTEGGSTRRHEEHEVDEDWWGGPDCPTHGPVPRTHRIYHHE